MADRTATVVKLTLTLTQILPGADSPRDSRVLFNREGPKGLLIFLDTPVCVVYGMMNLTGHLYSVFCLFQSFRLGARHGDQKGDNLAKTGTSPLTISQPWKISSFKIT